MTGRFWPRAEVFQEAEPTTALLSIAARQSVIDSRSVGDPEGDIEELADAYFSIQ